MSSPASLVSDTAIPSRSQTSADLVVRDHGGPRSDAEARVEQDAAADWGVEGVETAHHTERREEAIGDVGHHSLGEHEASGSDLPGRFQHSRARPVPALEDVCGAGRSGPELTAGVAGEQGCEHGLARRSAADTSTHCAPCVSTSATVRVSPTRPRSPIATRSLTAAEAMALRDAAAAIQRSPISRCLDAGCSVRRDLCDRE